MSRTENWLDAAHDPRDPNPWLALYLDASGPLADDVKRAWLTDAASRSRQFVLPVVRPLARLSIVLIQLLKIVLPKRFTSSKWLHRTPRSSTTAAVAAGLSRSGQALCRTCSWVCR